MAKYKCNTKRCKLYGKDQYESKVHITYGNYGAINHTAPCPVCGEDRELVNDGLCTNMHGGQNCCNR